MIHAPPPRYPDASFIAGIFTDIAEHYDRLNDILSLGLSRSWRRRAASLAYDELRRRNKAYSPGSAVDLACGTGDLTAELARMGWKVQGTDIVSAMLNQARRKYPEITFSQQDALHTSFADEAFELVTTAFSLRNVESVEALLKEMARLARPGGLIMTLELTRPKGVLGILYAFYLRMLPFIGGLFTGNKKAYAHLANSIKTFMAPCELAEIMRCSGLTVRTEKFLWGIVTVHLGFKPDPR